MKKSSLALIAIIGLCLMPAAFARDSDTAHQHKGSNSRNGASAPVLVDRQTAHSAQKGDTRKVSVSKDHPIDIVICLDTSNSMDGLIGSAKQKIWDIVNALATAKPKPYLRVALYAYGSPTFGSQTGFVHKEVDLSDDLDKVFAALTALRTNGGDEYCARVISAAADEQPWDDDKKALKIIVVAGNEPATQDRKLNVFDTASSAIRRGIIINTIYCGSPSSSEAEDWRKIASTADGQFAAIDQERGMVAVSTPFDRKLAELNSSINSTYVAYGKEGAYGQQKQAAADSLSALLGASNVASRAVAKSGGQYRNYSWDLVDASSEKGFSLSKMKNEELPAEMQKLSSTEQQAYLDKKVKERADIQKQIADLNVQRAKFIQDELKKTGKPVDKAFDTAMLHALRQQAQRNGFTFDPNK
jgi:hypothetical protein